MARMGVHLGAARKARQDARQAREARNALDACGYASIPVRAGAGRIVWHLDVCNGGIRSWGNFAYGFNADGLCVNCGWSSQ